LRKAVKKPKKSVKDDVKQSGDRGQNVNKSHIHNQAKDRVEEGSVQQIESEAPNLRNDKINGKEELGEVLKSDKKGNLINLRFKKYENAIHHPPKCRECKKKKVKRSGDNLISISKNIIFHEYVSIIKAYFKQGDSYIRSLIMNKNGEKVDKQNQKKVVAKKERLQLKEEAKQIQRTLSCFRIFYSLKNDAKQETSKSTETIFRERDLTYMIKIIPHLKDLIIKKINENLQGIEGREDLEFSFLERCQQCHVVYRKEFGHLCKWRRENAGQLEVPDVKTKEGDPIYLTPVTFNAQTVDEQLDKFILYKELIEPLLPRMMLFALEDLEHHPSVVSAYIYFRSHVSIHQREEWIQFREHVVIPFIYNKFVEEQLIENPTIKGAVRKIKEEVDERRRNEELFNHYEDEINVLNGNVIGEIVTEVAQIAQEMDLKQVTRKEVEQLIECEIEEHSVEMESDQSKRLQLIGIAAIKTIDDEYEYTRLRQKHFDRYHYIIADNDTKLLIGGRCKFGNSVCPFTNSDGECTKYCAKLWLKPRSVSNPSDNILNLFGK
jgi:hypothetical protein